MPQITAAARAQYLGTLAWYLAPERGRIAAARNLRAAYNEALALIDADPFGGTDHPPRHEHLARYGFSWRKVGRYWFAWVASDEGSATITNVVFETVLDGTMSDDQVPDGRA